MTSYVDYEYYYSEYNGTLLTEQNADEFLSKASSEVDTLTFNRIVAIGFDNLTNYQKKMVQDVICELAEFQSENKEFLTAIFNSYSINGVNMDFSKSVNLQKINGIYIPNEIYNDLSKTGLTCRGFMRGC